MKDWTKASRFVLLGMLLPIGMIGVSCTSKTKKTNVLVTPSGELSGSAESSTSSSNTPYTNQHSEIDWPIDEARMTRGYMPNPKRGKRPHWGIDLAGPKGTPILAAHDGTVIYVGKAFKGFGRMILLEGRNGFATVYAHLSKANVKLGQKVAQGEVIGGMGRTGRATGVHLHFEVRRGRGPVDPLSYLPNASSIAKGPAFGEKNTPITKDHFQDTYQLEIESPLPRKSESQTSSAESENHSKKHL